jgi:HEAT repeat protein
MSEVRYRRLLHRIHDNRSRHSFENEFTQFTGAVLESHLPLVDQLRLILSRSDLEMSRQAVRVAHSLRIHELAPDLMHLFKTVDAFEGRFIKNAVLLALGYLRHDEIHAFLLAIFQSPGDITYRRTAAEILKGGKKQPDMALPFFHMAENLSELTEMRCHAIEGLFHHGGPRVLPLLVPFLQDESGQVRWAALRAFEKWGNAFFASVIQPLTNDDYQWDTVVTIGMKAQTLLRKWESANQN